MPPGTDTGRPPRWAATPGGRRSAAGGLKDPRGFRPEGERLRPEVEAAIRQAEEDQIAGREPSQNGQFIQVQARGRGFLLLLAVAVSALFLFMIKGFLIALVLGAIFSGLAHPLYSWLLGKMPGKRSLASALTLVILLLAVGLPLAAFLGLVAANALDIGQVAVPWIKQNAAQPSVLEQRLMERLPILSYIEPYRCLLYTSPSPRDGLLSRMPSSA